MAKLSTRDKDYREILIKDQALEELDRICEMVNGRDYLYLYNVDSLDCEMTNHVEYWLLVEHRSEDGGTEVTARKAEDVYQRMVKIWNNSGYLEEYRVFLEEEMASFDDMRCYMVTESLFYPSEEIVARYE